MEKQTFMNLTIRNTQLMAYALFNFSNIIGIVLTMFGLFKVLTPQDIPLWVSICNGVFWGVCNLLAYLLLSRISTNLPTRNVVKWIGVILFVVALLSIVFDVYRTSYELSSLELSSVNAIFFILKTVSLLYLFGAIVRNNSTCKRAKVAVNVLFVIAFVGVYFASQIIPLVISHEGLEILNIIQSLTYLVCTYFLFTSDVFDGQTNNEPIPVGAYRFWNRYFTWYIVTIMCSAFFLILFMPLS